MRPVAPPDHAVGGLQYQHAGALGEPLVGGLVCQAIGGRELDPGIALCNQRTQHAHRWVARADIRSQAGHVVDDEPARQRPQRGLQVRQQMAIDQDLSVPVE